MAKALRVVGKVAGIASVILVPFNPALAAILAIVATAANIGAQALTKPPPARGSITQMLVSPDAPSPYPMGEGHFGGVLRHDVGYGATLKKVPNPYRFMAVVYGVGGPMEGPLQPRVDFAAPSSWYTGFLFTDTQLGETPESTALAPQWSGTPGWGSAYKLSGQAAIGWSFLFDKDGKRFASGIPLLGAYAKWVKIYDPRLDSTQPGGSGPHRIGDETTYEWSENPALHAAMYAYGRYQNGKRVMGIGMPADAIEWSTVMAWANVCEANGWTMFGVVYEPGDRWANLKDICFAGGGEPVAGGTLTFKYAAPVVALDTITEDDLTDDVQSVMTMQPYRDRLNTVTPKYRSPDHNWELIDAEPVVNDNFLNEDGEEKRDVWPFNFVKNVDQASQLAAYRLFDTRELAPITLTCKPRLRSYRPGECLALDIPSLGLGISTITLGDEPLTLGGEYLTMDGTQLAVILSRDIDPTTMKVRLVLMGETPAKHDYCLGRTGVAPPTPTLGQTSQERDELIAATIATPRAAHEIVGFDPAVWPLFADDDSIDVSAFIGTLDDGRVVDFPADTTTLTSLASGTRFGVFYDEVTETYSAVEEPATVERSDSDLIFVGWQATSAAGVFPQADPPPGGAGGDGGFYNYREIEP